MSRRSLSLTLLLLAICLVYANSFANSFHFDDFHTVTDNPAVRSLGNLPRIFTDTTAFSVLPANQTYRPVVTASLALDYALGHGYAPFWFHLSTLLWFLVTVTVLFFFTERIYDRVQPTPTNAWLALGVAAWFGLHPAMAETVNYVIQRGDLYCTLGCLAALLLFARGGLARRRGLYLLPFALAMLSKPPAAVFPALLLLYVFFFESNTQPTAQRWKRSLLASVPALAVMGALLLLQARMTPKSFLPSILSPEAYRLTQPFVWLRYAGALFLPLHLNVDTDQPAYTSWNPAVAAGFVFVTFLAAMAVYAGRRRRWSPIAFGLLWFVLTQLPTSLYPLSEVENDHRLFFSFPGLMIAVVWGLRLGYGWLRARPWAAKLPLPFAAATLAALSLGSYALGAHRRNAVWRSEASLWADDVAKSPHNGRGLMIYGLTRMNAGDDAGALALFNRALQFTPNYPTLEINLGVVNGLLAARGQPALADVAERHFQRAVMLAPGDDTAHAYYGRWLLGEGRLAQATAQLETAVRLNPQRAMGRDLLLSAYEQEGKIAAAHELARQTLAVIPEDATACAVLANRLETGAGSAVAALIEASLAEYRAGRFQPSIDKAKEALTLDPRSAEAWNNVGAGYGALSQWAPAMDAEHRALQLNPGLGIAANNLRWFASQEGRGQGKAAPSAADLVDESLRLNQVGRYEEAIAADERALRLDPRSAEAWNNIAAANEELHRWDQAVGAAQKAIALRPDFPLARNNLAWSLQQQSSGQGGSGLGVH